MNTGLKFVFFGHGTESLLDTAVFLVIQPWFEALVVCRRPRVGGVRAGWVCFEGLFSRFVKAFGDRSLITVI